MAETWYVFEGQAGFMISRTLDRGWTLLATCASYEDADRVSEGLQALTRLCRCGAVQPKPVPHPVSTLTGEPCNHPADHRCVECVSEGEFGGFVGPPPSTGDGAR